MLNTLSTKAYIAVTEGLRSFKNDERGVTAIEYGLIAIAIAAFIIYVFYKEGSFINVMKDKFSSLASQISETDVGKLSIEKL